MLRSVNHCCCCRYGLHLPLLVHDTERLFATTPFTCDKLPGPLYDSHGAHQATGVQVELLENPRTTQLRNTHEICCMPRQKKYGVGVHGQARVYGVRLAGNCCRCLLLMSNFMETTPRNSKSGTRKMLEVHKNRTKAS